MPGTFVSAAGGTFETVMPGTFHSATGGTFETVLGGTIKPLPSPDGLFWRQPFLLQGLELFLFSMKTAHSRMGIMKRAMQMGMLAFTNA